MELSLAKKILIVWGVVMAALAVLAWRAHWFPHRVAQQDIPGGERMPDFTVEIYRVNPVRSLRSLFLPYPEAAMWYECRVRDGKVTLTSFSLRFADGFVPSTFAFSVPHRDRSSATIAFSFNGDSPLLCDIAAGNVASWRWQQP